MDIRRVVLYAALALVTYSLWNAWQHDYPPALAAIVNNKPAVLNDGSLLPNVSANESTAVKVSNESVSGSQTTKSTRPLIQVKTDVFAVTIDSLHGDIVNTELLDYPVNVNEPQKPITLLLVAFIKM